MSLSLTCVPTGGADSSRQVPVDIKHENGSFKGELSVSIGGSLEKTKVEWNGTVQNTSPHKVFRATFCLKAFDSADHEINVAGSGCIVTFLGEQFQPGMSLVLRGKRHNIKISNDKAPVQVTKFAVVATEVFDEPPNLRNLNVRCPLVWPSAIRVFADNKFRPTMMDKASYTATFAYDGGRMVGSTSTKMLREFTHDRSGILGPVWESFRIDSASLYLREDTPGVCTAEVKMAFAGFGKPLFQKFGSWYAMDSNYHFEKVILDGLKGQSNRAEKSDMENAINQLPTLAPPPKASENLAQPQLTITSEPTGADIEIDGEFIGNTPTTITAKEGSVSVKVKKTGFQPWERTLRIASGDKRTLNAELVR
jgi:PEGA domain